MAGSRITYEVDGRAVSAYRAHGPKGAPGVVVLHAWWGLNPFFEQLSDQIAAWGYTVLAPDLNQGSVATTVEEAEALQKRLGSAGMREAVVAAVNLLSRETGSPVGVIGFSAGAWWTIVAATDVPDKVAAAVVFYGTGAADPRIAAHVLGHHSDTDEWEPMEGVEEMATSMRDAGIDATFHTYHDVPHWFVESNRAEFRLEAAELAWQRTRDFLKQHLKG